jgi:hypothetical protein
MKTATQHQDVILELEPVQNHPAPAVQSGQAIAMPTPATLLQMAVQQGADLDRLERLMALQERWESNEAKKEFTAAMAAFKSNPPEIFKDKLVGFENKDGSFTGYKHATLGNVVEKIVAGLAKVGVSHKWSLRQSNGQMAVTCILTHRMGHSDETTMEAGADVSGKKNSIQAVASTVSYLQRYTLLAATGLATQDQDDDANKSEELVTPEWVVKFLDQIAAAATRPDVLAVWDKALPTCDGTGDALAHDCLHRAVADRLKELKASQ